MKKLKSLNGLIGNTPLIKINYCFKGKKRCAFFKAEWFNLTGSIKDRVAFNLIKQAYKQKKLKSQQEIVEVTSGNMGISLAAIGAYLGHKVTVFMPKFCSEERKQLLRLYSANLIETENFFDAFRLSKIYANKHHAFLTNQFENIANANIHAKQTAKEILSKLDVIEGFVAGVGTSGTLTGVGKTLKTKRKSKIFAVEPATSPVLSGGSPAEHKIQGLSDGLIPKLFDPTLVDKIIEVNDNDAIAMAQKLAKQFGLGVGISGGANFVGTVLCDLNNVVSIFPDDNKKYLSTELTNNVYSHLVDEIKLLNFEII